MPLLHVQVGVCHGTPEDGDVGQSDRVRRRDSHHLQRAGARSKRMGVADRPPLHTLLAVVAAASCTTTAAPRVISRGRAYKDVDWDQDAATPDAAASGYEESYYREEDADELPQARLELRLHYVLVRRMLVPLRLRQTQGNVEHHQEHVDPLYMVRLQPREHGVAPQPKDRTVVDPSQ